MFFTVALVVIPRANAEELQGLEYHGFLSQGYINTTANNYLAMSKGGSFEFTEVGINFTKSLTDTLRTGIQLFARQLGPTGGFDAKMDWFYLDYHPSDLFGFQFGRVKIPFGLYNESSDVDSARAPVLLPQSIYPTQNRNYLLAQDGVQIYGYTGSSSLGALAYRLYAGTIQIDILNLPATTFQIQEINVPYVAGSRVMWETPVDGLRLGGSFQTLKLDATLDYTASSTLVSTEIPAILWVGSAEYTRSNLLLAAEYSRWYVTVDKSSNPTLFPNTYTVSEREYVMAAYHLSNRLQPALYYSLFFPNVNDRVSPQGQQHDLSATLRVDINPYWLVKLEGHYMHGTAGLSTTLNNHTPLSALAENWGVFLVKTTAFF